VSGHWPGCIRGTDVYLETDPELTCVCTCYGETDIATADDPTISEAIAFRHLPMWIWGAPWKPQGEMGLQVCRMPRVR
jgi:hypothetical protein